MPEINSTLHQSPIPCKHCDYALPPTKNYQTGELTYHAHPNGICDRCLDAMRCIDCQHFERCTWLIQRKASDTPCDWEPSRFVSLTN